MNRSGASGRTHRVANDETPQERGARRAAASFNFALKRMAGRSPLPALKRLGSSRDARRHARLQIAPAYMTVVAASGAPLAAAGTRGLATA